MEPLKDSEQRLCLQTQMIAPTRNQRERPISKLTGGLMHTYKFINQVYYAKKSTKKKEQKLMSTSEPQDYVPHRKEVIDGRWVVQKNIGKGSFGRVIWVYDKETEDNLAMKMIKRRKPFVQQAQMEIKLLRKLMEADPKGQHHCVRLIANTMFKGHPCIFFELLSYNLYEVLKYTQFKGISLTLIYKFGRQLLEALAFLSTIEIIHCDLKPENILLCDPRRSALKVIDFGSSCIAGQGLYSYIQSRFYRSPEVMLGMTHSCAIDMWSLGCILVEMHTGQPLFSGANNQEQMGCLTRTLGLPSTKFLAQGDKKIVRTFFKELKNDDGGFEYGLYDSVSEHTSEQSDSGQMDQTLRDVIYDKRQEILAESGPKKTSSLKDYENFVDMITQMLAFDPEDRLKPSEGLKHPFIKGMSTASQESKSVSGREKVSKKKVDSKIQN
uniref:Protein kinase domain-containing protein n=1 Tax=Octactis speculum TaxID=3111310 RepID=A0A7S2G643_9STRA|mmetsp:Transcript_39630/g.53887  ORF Transcript_39630/g.53887 Transcript_39630/m.53887 type:complete len:439 (+) Transcript_39630:234-1550(+)|eukprot:CAMPEP_0185744090 /NCGR_PEP_ID=MMETSP1174-20130828/2099_1 /TAXON_ID=35687 /ORGANISM="Dictyocha speculum, Strain CCMP1381" /LENGTH=438 /DNA_ID=CAMNT_0028417267 /DNA_START=234 /DNA_END=1550 /DNA_ORIENTATION=+